MKLFSSPIFKKIASALTPAADELSLYAKGDDRFYQKSSAGVEAALSLDGHLHDDRYYTEAESDARFVNVVETGVGNFRRIRGLVKYEKTQSNITGYLVIQTNMTLSGVMTSLYITGYNYANGMSDIDLKVGFYPYVAGDAFYNVHAINGGTFPLAPVRLMKRTSDGKVAIVLESAAPGSTWQHPKIAVDGIFGRLALDSSESLGWTADFVSDLSAYTASATVTVTNGTVGPQGPAGATGATGPQGPQGVKGDTGNMGPQGPAGLTGTQGPQGVAGATGAQGPKGDAGATGPQGAKGDTGATGPQGAAGATGAAGEAATVSVSGTTTGAAGTAAAVTQGGTAQARTLQFTIPRGDTGATGPQGATGSTGATGPQGPAGPTGAASTVAGPQGPQGPVGPAGTTTWAGITDKPATFTPATHTHDDRYYTEAEVNAMLLAQESAWQDDIEDAFAATIPGSEMASAERTTSWTTTNTVASSTAATSIISSLIVTVTGEGKPVEIRFAGTMYCSSANANVKLALITNGVSGTQSFQQLGVANASGAVTGYLTKRMVLASGTQYTFQIAVAGVGTTTAYANSDVVLSLAVIRR